MSETTYPVTQCNMPEDLNFYIKVTIIMIHTTDNRFQFSVHWTVFGKFEFMDLMQTSSIQRCVYHSSVKIFKQLPQNIFKYYNNILTFKTLLRGYFVKNAFYSIQEFLSIGHNDVDIWTFIFNFFDYFVMHIVALKYFVFIIFTL